MRGVFLIAWFVLATICAFGQPYNYSLRNYKAVDGLPQSQVRIILEDKNGYLWVGTEGGGLARFDGRTFKVYTTLDGLQSNLVNSLLLDAQQNLWIVHPRGLTKYDGVSFKKFEQPGSRTSATRLRRIFDFNDTIFFMSAPGYIGKIHNDSVYYWSKPIFPRKGGTREQLISFARMSEDGTLIFCINQRAFYCRKGNDDYWIRVTDQFNYIVNTFTYEKKTILKTDNGYWALDLEKRAIVRQDLPVIHDVVQYDSVQNVFWTVYGNYLLKERLEGEKVKADTVMRDIDISQIVIDSEGNTWLGSNGNGLYKYFVQDFDRCGSGNLTNVMAIYHDRAGANWIGSMTRGLFKMHKGKVTSYGKNPVYCITEGPDGTLYAGGPRGLGTYNQQKDSFEWKEYKFGPWKTAVLNIQFDKTGAMYLATGGGGVIQVKDGNVVNYTVDNGLNSNVIMSIFYSEYYDQLFIGDEFGLSEIKDRQASPLAIEGLDNTSVLAIHPYRDSLLLLSTGGSGLVVYNPKSKYRKFVTTNEGLASDFIYFTAVDDENRLWIGTEKGITRAALDDYFNVTEHLHFDYDNGLTGVEANQNAFCFYDDNKFFGLIDGLYIFNDYKRPDKKSFNLHLTKIALSYGEFSTKEYSDSTSGFFRIPVNLNLPPDRNHISFHFNKVDKRYPKSVKFKYFLQNFDKTWSLPSSNTEVTYSNLPSGDYTLMVLSSNNDGSWEQNPLAYNFRIRTPFYAKTSFIVGMILLLAALISMILYLRVRQRVRRMMMLERIRLKEQETVRKDIARDFHDEMGNQLTRIINYISLLKMNGKSVGEHHDLYTKVEQSAKYLYTGTRDFIWSIDPSNDELSKLFIHIRDFGEKLFEEKNINFRAINKVKDKIKLPYGFSREANLIFKEAMTNAFKYSHANNVTLSLKQEDEDFIMCLEDDGVGYSIPDLPGQGGLRNIRERAEKINVQISVDSELDKGTRISIQFKNSKKLQYGIAV